MKEYKSICHTTSNENGLEQIELESDWPLWKSLWFAVTFTDAADTKKEAYVILDDVWVEKGTGEVPDHDMQYELFRCKQHMKNVVTLADYKNFQGSIRK